jgi:hypothetical protein
MRSIGFGLLSAFLLLLLLGARGIEGLSIDSPTWSDPGLQGDGEGHLRVVKRPSVDSSAWSGLKGGEEEMGDFPLLRLIPAQPPGFDEVPEVDKTLAAFSAKARNWPSPSHRARIGRPSGWPLAEVKGSLGPLLVPSYLPEGFSHQRAYVNEPRPVDPRVKLLEAYPSLTFAGPDDTHLIIQISSREPFVYVKEGFFEPIAFGEGPAYLIRGVWLTFYISGRLVEKGWNEDFTLRLMFIRDGRVVTVEGMPASAFTKEELIKVAESLQPY